MRQLNNVPELFNPDLKTNFVINDIELHIPPTAISIHKEGLEYAWKTLRSKVSTKIASGNGTYHAQVNITFAPDSLILLHRLISQVRNNPFVAIQNNFIAQSISETHAIPTLVNYFTVFGLNISNHPSSPGAFLVELDLRYFNYKPFGRTMSFKKDYAIKVEEGSTIKEYVHSIFPNYGDRVEAKKPVLKQSYKLNADLKTSRRIAPTETSFESFAPNKIRTNSITIDPRKSNAYKRYSNFLQLKYLNESFGINIIQGVEDPDKFIPNDVFVNKKLYNLFQGVQTESNNTRVINTIGLHEVKINNLKDDDLIKFRRDLTHAMLLSGLNTRIVTKEFRSLNLGGNFLFRYRKTLRRGIRKGMNEQRQNEIISENRKKLFKLFSEFEKRREDVKEAAKPVESGITLEAPAERELRLVIDPISSTNTISSSLIRPSQTMEFYSPGSKVLIGGKEGNYIVSNIDTWNAEETGKLAFPIMTFCSGGIEYRGNDVIIKHGEKDQAQEITYLNIQINEPIKNWIESKGSVLFPAGTIVGYFDATNYFEINCSAQLINDLCLSLSGKALEENRIASSKVIQRKMDQVYLNPEEKGFLNKEDVPFINRIKDLIEEEGFSQYVYRSGLENVFQKALILSFDSNLYEEDVKLITGKDTFGVNADSFPKLEQDITNISCSLRNIISSIPILGYAYPTHQYLGSIEPNYQFNFVGHTPIGDGLPQKIKDLEGIRANTAYMAKNFPQIPDAANIVVESLITKLVGSFKYFDNDEKILVLKDNKEGVIRDIKPRFLISSMDTFTIEGSPGAVGLNLRFSESKPYDEEEVRAAKSSEIDENYLGRYASVLQQGGIDIGAPDIEEGDFQPVSYSRAKYVAGYWNTKYFGAKSYYGKAKWFLRKDIKNHIKGDIDKNAFDFCKDYLDPLQDFLNLYKNRRLNDMHNGKKLKLDVFSTLDRPIGSNGRTTFSNHFTGAAVDLRIKNMHVAEAAAIIELLEEKGFFNDSIGQRVGAPFYNSGKAAINGRDKRKRLLGIGVYGSNASSLPFVQPSIWNAETQLMDGDRPNGFVHIDANFIVDAQNRSGYSWKLYDYRRRWGGKSNEDKFDSYRTFWNRDIKLIKQLINNKVNETLKEYSENLSSEEPVIDAEESPNIPESDENEGDVANKEDSGPKPDTRETVDEQGYKLESTLPQDLITFLRERTDLTSREIESLYKVTVRELSPSEMAQGAAYGVHKVGQTHTSNKEYLFEIAEGRDRYEIKFFPPKGQKRLSDEQERVIKALQAYYRKEIRVNTNVSTEYGRIIKNIPSTNTLDMTSEFNAGQTQIQVANKDIIVSKTFSFSTSEVRSSTSQRDQEIQNKLNNNKLLKSFTELASLMLTEPYLYTETKEELEKEMQFIQEQLFNFPVLPTYYTSIEQLFTGTTTLGIVDDINKYVEQVEKNRSYGMALGTTAAGAVNAWRLAKLVAAGVSWPLLVVDAAMILFEVFGLYSYLTADLDDASASQLKRVLHGLQSHAVYLSDKESVKEYVNYYKQLKNSVIGENVQLGNEGQKRVGDFLDEAGEADTVLPAIRNHIKPIYTELSIFKKFNAVANRLDSDSRAANLIRRRLQDSKGLYDSEGNLDESLASFALADELTTDEIKNYLIFLFTFPQVDDSEIYNGGTIEQDHNYIVGIKDDKIPVNIFYKEQEEDDPYIWVGTNRSAPIRYTGENYNTTSGLLAIQNAYNSELYDVNKYPYLLTYQVNQENGIKEYFEKIKTKEGLRKQNRVKLAYLRSLLSALLEEHMHLNPEIVENSGDDTLLRVLDGSTVFELLEENAYPDVDLPQDPENPYNNSNLSPCFYYNDPNDVLDIMITGAKSKEAVAAEKILKSSIQFQKGLREGIFTGSESRLDANDSAMKTINEIIDPSEILRSTSEFMITGRGDKQKQAYINPIRIGLHDNETSSDQVNLPSPIEVTVNEELIHDEGALRRLQTSTTNTLNEAAKSTRETDEYEKSSEFKAAQEFSRINSAFGSSLGFKIKPEFLDQLKEVGDEKLKRTLGENVQQDYSEKSIMGLSEDSSENIYKLKTMKNAFPTFRLYLIEEDEIYSDRLTAFDDFFYYNSVISFNVHNSRELAASTATIQLQNISGVLDGTKKRILRDVDLNPNLKEEDLKNEGNFIDSIVLRPGVTVQLRAGYESNTNNLDILISGKITDINYAQNNTICNMTVQSFGNELTALRKGNGNKGSENSSAFYSTHQLLGSMMMSDELKHFGRSKVGAVFQIGEYKDFSLDLDIYKRESSFNFSLSRGFFDWVRDHSFGIGIGVGLLSLGLPLIKMSAKTEIVTKVLTWYSKGQSRAAMSARGIGAFINLTMVKPISFVNPFGVSKRAQTLIIRKAQALAKLSSRKTGASQVAINSFDDAIEYLITSANYGGKMGPVGLEFSGLASIPKGLDRVIRSRGALNTNIIAHGYLNGSVVTLFQKIAQGITLGRYQAGNKLGEEFLKQVIVKQRGLTALGLSGMAPSALSKGWLAGRLGMDLGVRGYTSIMLPLSIGFGSIATTMMLGAADVIIDSAKYLYFSMIGKFEKDKNKLKKKKLLSPQDDNIFAPHPQQYMKNIPRGTYSYFGSLLFGGKNWVKSLALTSGQIITNSTWGMVNLSNSSALKDLKLNPFKLIDKRLDIDEFENTFIINGQTIWEILHECTLRHPGYIYGVRPYGNSLEYRVFFGVPSQRYWSKKISNNQIRKLNAAYIALKDASGRQGEEKRLNLSEINNLFPKEYALYNKEYPNASLVKKREHFTIKAYEFFLRKTKDRFVPFRQFHMVSSKRNLISNNIIISSHNMINAVSVNWINNRKDLNGDEQDLSPLDHSPHLSKYANKMETFRFRANRNIGMGQLKEKTVSYRNIVGPSNALRYGLGELLYGTRKMYEGSLTILGDTKINPWDVIVLHDDVTAMYGPVEVCSVTHMFSFETGFITDVEVNALVTANEELTHPIIMQNLVYETRARIFDEYNSFDSLGSTPAEKEKTVREIVQSEVEELIEKEVTKNSGFLRRTIGQGIVIDANIPSKEKRDEVIEKVTQHVIDNYRNSRGANFLNDLVPQGATIPKELTDALEDIGALGAGISGSYFIGETLRRNLIRNSGLKLYGSTPMKMGLFFASSLILSQSGDAVNSAISTSYNSGDLGKNLFRQHILSRMGQGNIIQVYPLVKDGLPLVTGGFEEVDETEKWNNMLGYIFNNASSTIKGYLKRQQEMKAYGKRVIQEYDKGELTSMRSAITVNLAKAAQATLGFENATSLLGYMYMDED